MADICESAALVGTELSFSYAPGLGIAQQIGRITGIPPKRTALSRDGPVARTGTVRLSISSR